MPRPRTPSLELRKRPRQERSQEMLERILDSAQQLSREMGIKGLSTAKIAAHAGLSVGSLYQYFPNKEAIMVEVARRWLARFRAVVDALRSGPPPRTWRAFSAAYRGLTRHAAQLYRDSADMLALLELMRSVVSMRGIEEEHDAAIVAGLAQWLREVQPAMTSAVAQRLGRLTLEVGHVCLAEAAVRSPAEAEHILRDLETMLLAVIRPQLGLR